MKVVRHKVTGRLVYREAPDFKKGLGVINAVLMGYGSKSELEEVEVTPEEWEAELLLRKKEAPLPSSEHIAKLKSVDTANARPAIVTRRFVGENHDVACLVTQSVAELYQAGQIEIGDYVLVSFIEEIPDTEEKLIAIVTDKVYKTW